MLAKFLQSTFSYGSEQKQQIPVEETRDEYLPGNLAGRILDLEIECEGQQISKDNLAQLITLYTNAIEYYESISSEKYKIYKKRIQSFLSKPCVESMLKGKDGQLSLKKEMVERNRLHAIVNTKQEIVKIIEKSEKRADSNKKIVENLMRNQEQTLEARIERRKSMSNKSTKTDNDDFEEGEKVANEKMSVNLLIGGIKDRNVKRVFI